MGRSGQSPFAFVLDAAAANTATLTGLLRFGEPSASSSLHSGRPSVRPSGNDLLRDLHVSTTLRRHGSGATGEGHARAKLGKKERERERERESERERERERERRYEV